MKSAYKRYLKVITSFALSMTILAGGISHEAIAVEPYKDLVIGPFSFTDVSLCESRAYGFTPAKGCDAFQVPSTIWSFSIKNSGKQAFTNVRTEIVLSNETGADLYNNILVVTSRLEPGETIWVAPEVVVASSQSFLGGSLYSEVFGSFKEQGSFQGVTQGTARVVSAKKSQPGKYRIKGFATGDFGSISDKVVGSDTVFSSAVKGNYKAPAYSVEVALPTAIDSKKVPAQWVTALLKDPNGKLMGGFKFRNDKDLGPPFRARLVQDKEMLKRFVTVEIYVGRI